MWVSPFFACAAGTPAANATGSAIEACRQRPAHSSRLTVVPFASVTAAPMDEAYVAGPRLLAVLRQFVRTGPALPHKSPSLTVLGSVMSDALA